MQALKKLTVSALLLLVALALLDQLVRDPRYRDWHGSVLGVPYDFRLPNAARLQQSVWAPDDGRLLTPHLFGIGWTLNLGRLLRLIQTAQARV